MKNRKNKIIDIWRGIYSLVIPTVACIIYWSIYMAVRGDILNYSYITESENFTSMLEAIISFASLIIGVFGFLLPIFITSKKEFTLAKYFIDNIDKKAFSFNLRMIIVSGFIVVFISCILFLSDIFSEWFKQGIILLWIWWLFYFASNSYRFVSLIIRLFLEDKNEVKKEIWEPIDSNEEEKLKESIRRSRI
mgnify:CR=1 FL=1